MEDLPGQLRSLQAPLRSLQASMESFSGLAVDVGEEVRGIQASLRAAEAVYDSIEEATAEAATIVADTEGALDTQRVLASVAVVLATFVLATLQVVPAIIGRRLLGREPDGDGGPPPVLA